MGEDSSLRRIIPVIMIVPILGVILTGCSGQSAQGNTTTSPAGAASPVSQNASAKSVSFVNAGLLVESGDLAKLVDDKNVRIIDARTESDYKAGHIQGAINIPVEATFDPNAPKGIVGSASLIENLLSQKGISNENRIIVYDVGKDNRAARVFWTLEYYGHSKVVLLNGGYKKWQKENLPISTDESKAQPARFTAKADESKFSSRDEVLALIGKSGVSLLDARSPAEYRGEDVRSKRAGHIPGAVNIEWVNMFTDGDIPVLKSAEVIAKAYEENGVTKDKEVHAY